ncbi:glycosyltransferase family 4 protein [Priestia megaterium]|uniref:glycosyltransferase family 4 protein n=1 Tax=Priestia megaterium TaxID=1404 RepID=UPI00234F1333|nr:glycosyltransferase family 4 protein [Priestia megaterium]MDC7723219.1 glycosyltransferase family 4 protein [Priestia megaterium]
MDIVYISMLTGKKSAGLSYSIPAQVKSQEKFDNVFWYNINNISKNQLINGENCNNKGDFPALKIGQLPSPFNKPDLVIFEGVYIFDYINISKECKRRGIPYIVIPRSSLTKNAQKKKVLKKIIGNTFFFKSFINGAIAIQYLTSKEYEDSGDKWNNRHLIIPNGVEPKVETKQYNENREIRGTFIGRADSYQKGIDLLLDACALVKEDLKKKNCKIDIFAPTSSEDKDNIQAMIIDRGLSDFIIKHDGVYGTEKEKALLNSDFFVLTSRFEGHPMGLIEALSYGVPCIVTEGTNMADEIKTYEAGWAVETTVDGIVKAFKNLFSEKKELMRKGQNAVELSRLYSWEKIAEVSHMEYRKLIESGVSK